MSMSSPRKIARTPIENGPSAGDVRPTDTSAVSRISVPAIVRAILVLRGTPLVRPISCQKRTVGQRGFAKEYRQTKAARHRGVRLWDDAIPRPNCETARG